jgi:hypothetical protein
VTTNQFPKRKKQQSLPEEFPPGTIGVISGELTRYSHFSMAMTWLQPPPGSQLAWDPGANITGQCNKLVKHARETDAAWLWIIGDDHVFNPNILTELLAHDVDVVVPLCLQRSAPFYPVVYKGLDGRGHHQVALELEESGIQEIYAAGSAGMMIQRRVLDKLPEEPFTTFGPHQNEDLEFCRAVRQAGFKIWVDVDTHLAHIGTMVVWPQWMGEEGWQVVLDIGPGGEGIRHRMPVKRILQSPALTAA